MGTCYRFGLPHSNCTFSAISTVLALINTAPNAGLRTELGYSTPAASGMATTS